ncbi:hypothetical protein ACFPK9_11920 [Rubritalea spongiae]|uniref:Uncharacterized protein n=1 Tax=Rubritalea spongiae TaxID=430797 RepID=A0ABW5E4R1_9BACT
MKKIIIAGASLALGATLQANEFTPLIVQTSTFTDSATQSVKFLSGTENAYTGTTQAIKEDFEQDSFAYAKFELYTIPTQLKGTADADSIADAVDSQKLYEGMTGIIPSAEIKIQALDRTDTGIPKTRVSEPVDIEITVKDLLPDDPDALAATKFVSVEHSYTHYADNTFSVTPEATTTEAAGTYIIEKNGADTYGGPSYITQIPAGSDANAIRGEEKITVNALTGELASEKFIVCPMTKGELLGIEEGKTYNTAPSVEAELTDIYPGKNSLGNSSFYAVICYKADKLVDQSELTQEFIDENSIINVNTTSYSRPDSHVAPVDVTRLKNHLNTNGIGKYQMELIQSTVFGIDRMADNELDYDPRITINGNISTAE